MTIIILNKLSKKRKLMNTHICKNTTHPMDYGYI